ncbi:ADP-ribosylglycohydrolase family protein [Nocardia sp. 004]|uniref:ADP-ribosylglycohydrolase family protein n=1 Tax=Nocardia sp. 004 TaxID=3385978 RepID=UPI0039A2C108
MTSPHADSTRSCSPGSAHDAYTSLPERLASPRFAGVLDACHIDVYASAQRAAAELGNGSLITAQNTVPFTLWVAAEYLDNYPAAITTCIAADGDIDTTSAIAGGIVAAYTGAGPLTGVPQSWIAAREPLPGWFDPKRGTRRREKSASSRARRWLSGTS